MDQAEQGGREFLARQPLQVPPSMSDSLADDRIELATLRAIDHPVDDQYEAQNEEIILAQSSGEAAAADAGPPASAEDDLAALAQKTNNPISDAWLLITQNDTTIIDGDAIDTEVVNSLKFQPVLSVPVFEGDWNFVVRPVLQFQSLPFDDDVGDLLGASLNDIVSDPDLAALAADPDGRTNGLGDSVLLTLLGPNTDDGWIYAGGLTQILPTASEDVLGQEKWQAGPAALVVRLGKDYGGFSVEDFNAGFLAQQWWSYAGDDDRDSTNQMDIQYFVNWKATPTQLIGMTPNISINWDADGGFFENKMAFPIGLGTIGLFKVGKLPIRYGLEAQYYLTGPDAVEREANFRFFIAPIIPNLLKAS
ncbi:MAG: hypothetical protein OEU92_21930 [Alphaproteobacteria bacterium]|nr:hypothetical protein [Alphaproteobacteria bacterium]